MAVHFVDPGMLRTELMLEKAVPVPDGAGGHVENWGEVATLFGRVEPVRADSRFGAGQALETVTHRITLRFRDGVASGMRFVKGSRKFEIVTVHDPDETGRYLVCRVREGGGEGYNGDDAERHAEGIALASAPDGGRDRGRVFSGRPVFHP